jgi:hypothetical protein
MSKYAFIDCNSYYDNLKNPFKEKIHTTPKEWRKILGGRKVALLLGHLVR